jgi:hypothetical protein
MESYLDRTKFGIGEFCIDLAYLVSNFRLRS